ncbi:MAG: 5'/3'-nucleotidase SurE [Candidatus Rifleibacteriota bacterium]
MKILLCNDDGITSTGLISLAEQLIKLGKVFVAAPDSERSAASNSLTLSHPLRVKEVNFPVEVEKAWAISGTPADCAKIALANLLDGAPDIVVSGINRGPNMCVDIFYSGTVAAAFEGAFKGIMSFSVSLDSFNADASYLAAAEWASECIKRLFASSAPKDRVYNINVPDLAADQIRGIKVTRSGKVDYQEIYDHRVDPYGRSYYWIQGNPLIVDKSEQCDIVAVKNGYVSITPLLTHLHDLATIDELEKILF